jgi:putative membrane protein
VTDQSIGGIVIWLPAAMMSVVALLLVINFMRLEEDRRVLTPDEESMAALARRWTGR